MNPNQNLSVPQFETTPPQESRHNKKRVARLVSEVALASLVVAGGAACGTEPNTVEVPASSSSDSTIGQSGDLTADAYNQKALDTLSYVGFSTLENEVRVQRYAAELDDNKEAALKFMRQGMTPAQNAIIKDDFPENKAAYSDQQILNRFSIDKYNSSILGNTAEGIDEGRKMLSVIMSPSNPGFTKAAEAITGNNGQISVYEISGPDYKRIHNVVFRDHKIGESGAELIYAKNAYSGSGLYMLFSLIEAPNGDSAWQFTDAYKSSDVSIQNEIKWAGEGMSPPYK